VNAEIWRDECRDSIKIEEAKVRRTGTGLSGGEAMDQVKTERNSLTAKALEKLLPRYIQLGKTKYSTTSIYL